MATTFFTPPTQFDPDDFEPVSARFSSTDEFLTLTGSIPVPSKHHDEPAASDRPVRLRRTSFVPSPRQRALVSVATGLLGFTLLLGVAGVALLA